MNPLGALGLYTETPLHCGAESGSGYVDLPIQRERHTYYPVIPGSTVKGVLRDEMKPGDRLGPDGVRRFFGSDEHDNASPGSVSFGDGQLVAFPVRSSGAPFHWVTCPFVLERAFRALGNGVVEVESPGRSQAWGRTAGTVLLEELRLEVAAEPGFFSSDGASGLARLLDLLPPEDRGFAHTRKVFPDRLLLVADQDFKELVEIGTEILTRIKLNDLGTTTTVDKEKAAELGIKDREGNLFVEEVVPPETLFLCPLRNGEGATELVTQLQALEVLRLGGDETIGRGLTHLRWVPAPGSEEG
jgi:CRISPR-associated protein Cmr4